ncbi:MAG: hypothetical protein V1831_01710 [Candidatus Woesearchaeota archaeon]
MTKASKFILIIVIVILIFTSGCINNSTQKQKEYEKCTSVCASVLEDDFVTMKLCMDECQKKFLEEELASKKLKTV